MNHLFRWLWYFLFCFLPIVASQIISRKHGKNDSCNRDTVFHKIAFVNFDMFLKFFFRFLLQNLYPNILKVIKKSFKNHPKHTSKFNKKTLQKISKNPPKIIQKSIKNHPKLGFGPLLDQNWKKTDFGTLQNESAASLTTPLDDFGLHFGTHFRSKIDKKSTYFLIRFSIWIFVDFWSIFACFLDPKLVIFEHISENSDFAKIDTPMVKKQHF